MVSEPERPILRWVSAVEFALGAAIVIGHNVFRIVPNEVMILFILGLVSVRLRERRWSAIGFKRPTSWMLVIWVALAAAALRHLIGSFVIDPLATPWWPPSEAPEGANEITGNIVNALIALGLVWTFAAFGEEIAYRGYLMKRAADMLGGSRTAWWISLIAVGVLFGYGHYYKGPTGMLDSAVAGLILGGAYLATGRTLWTPILAHGFIDTFAVVWVFFGGE
ncbi:MAG: CPBP family intramembrane glutamic endopeptidase [Terricaulis sp.]